MSSLDYLLNREFNKLKIVFKEIEFLTNKEIKELVLSYWNDCIYFYENKKYLEAFELVNYIWGMLDILANLKLIKVKNEKIKKWFKAEF